MVSMKLCTKPAPRWGMIMFDDLQKRILRIEEWLTVNAPHCASEQRHLDEGSSERAYWHYGYLMALRDVRAALGEE